MGLMMETCGEDALHRGGTQVVCKQKAAKVHVVVIVQPAQEALVATKQLAEANVMQGLNVARATQI